MLHTLSTTKKRKKRLGRGGARGKNAGGGHKGQRSRAGKRIRPALRDELQRIPKRRGHNKNRSRTVNASRRPTASVTLGQIERNFDAGTKITPKALHEKGLIRKKSGVLPCVKIVARGELGKKFTFFKCSTSVGAEEMITKVGGSVHK